VNGWFNKKALTFLFEIEQKSLKKYPSAAVVLIVLSFYTSSRINNSYKKKKECQPELNFFLTLF